MARSAYILIIFGLLFVAFIMTNLLTSPQPPFRLLIDYSEFIENVNTGKVKQVLIGGHKINGVLQNDEEFTTYIVAPEKTVQLLLDKNVRIEALSSLEEATWLNVFFAWLPTVLFCVFLWWFIGRPIARLEKVLREGKSR